MADKALPSQEVIRQLLRYEPDTGRLFWIHREPQWFSGAGNRTPEHAQRNWNSRFAGMPAFTAISHGHHCGAVLGVNYFAHRLVWKLMTGVDPCQVDHINGIRCDNRWINLRDVSNQENAHNRRLLSRNQSGHTGVWWEARGSKWVAYIVKNGRRHHLGSFQEFSDAVSARKEAEREMGFHEIHGRSA